MNLEELRSNTSKLFWIFLVLSGLLFLISQGEAYVGLAILVIITSTMLFTWILAVVADATVQTLKKEK